ncbi:MAG TPA: chorismate mutase, partial [Clostridiales bacterium]|nr:chorismate mutase [Clostridiales bacterium]
MELSEIRKMIDEIDSELVKLLCRRMDCSLKVSEYKAAHNMPVLNQQRENEILERVGTLCDEYSSGYGNAAKLIFATIMDASRGLQHSRMGSGSELKNILQSAQKNLIAPDKAR